MESLKSIDDFVQKKIRNTKTVSKKNNKNESTTIRAPPNSLINSANNVNRNFLNSANLESQKSSNPEVDINELVSKSQDLSSKQNEDNNYKTKLETKKDFVSEPDMETLHEEHNSFEAVIIPELFKDTDISELIQKRNSNEISESSPHSKQNSKFITNQYFETAISNENINITPSKTEKTSTISLNSQTSTDSKAKNNLTLSKNNNMYEEFKKNGKKRLVTMPKVVSNSQPDYSSIHKITQTLKKKHTQSMDQLSYTSYSSLKKAAKKTAKLKKNNKSSNFEPQSNDSNITLSN